MYTVIYINFSLEFAKIGILKFHKSHKLSLKFQVGYKIDSKQNLTYVKQ